MKQREVTITINGDEYTREVEDRKLLIHFLRDDLDLTGSHQGCVVGKCGACTVLHNGVPKKSCMLYPAQVDGDKITTVEGLTDIAEEEGTIMESKDGAELHPLQMGFKQNHGLQCGFCTPGVLMTGLALLRENSDATRDDIKNAISGNICRCTGYNSIVDSIEWAKGPIHDGEFPDEAEIGAEPVADGGCQAESCCLNEGGD